MTCIDLDSLNTDPPSEKENVDGRTYKVYSNGVSFTGAGQKSANTAATGTSADHLEGYNNGSVRDFAKGIGEGISQAFLDAEWYSPRYLPNGQVIPSLAQQSGLEMPLVFGPAETNQEEFGIAMSAAPGIMFGLLFRNTRFVGRGGLRGVNGVPSGGRIPWRSWSGYDKVTEGGQTYAQVGNRLYTRHAVDRMQPSGLGAPAGTSGPGRSFAPGFVEDVIQTGTTRSVTVNGVERTIHTSGTAQVVTEQGGRIVVTVNPFSGAP
jgi:hypothetical protein